ncbi:hypothetical protein PQU92_10150 [Asticcacaulis sp. BYS171W]|uniref:Uncharacterized protein n=1 Tax=Asticcacaulis aquaticus TaxID=2984212 RepID=A0ABT5HU95_9CAUL|nr:hypothetical protein [Asticcacaulis aquaticus]MDC7683640.1 hypothetical protein [Asticcacaulis aquaticus]
MKTLFCAAALILTAPVVHAQEAILKCAWDAAENPQLRINASTDYYRISQNSWKQWNPTTRTWTDKPCVSLSPFDSNGPGIYAEPNVYKLTCAVDITGSEYGFTLTGEAISFAASGHVVSSTSGNYFIRINRMDGSAAQKTVQEQTIPSTGKSSSMNIVGYGKCEKSVDPATIEPPPAPKPIM